MYLSKLEIFGFKSFAKKTEFGFKGGITGVVGPNGCGKSNVVDAIRWVLGEQKAGVLRSDRMENVIFNGSKTQKPLGMAEVSLTIENTKHILPIEYSEVVITRRLFRSGESQYLLNNTVCRLKDIMNLFMDTGMGANAYSVIELAMVEQILNGKAEERRHIFEEAAGVGKYKSRRKAAFRKLEATEADLLRLNDIISEVEKNVDSLKRQVQKAKRYQVYSDELKETELKLSSHKLLAIETELVPLTAEKKTHNDRREQLSAQIATEEAGIEEMRLKVLELEKQLVARQRDLNESTERIQKKEEDILVSQERIRAVQDNRARYGKEIEDLQKRGEMLREMRNSLEIRLQEMQEQLAVLEEELAVKKRELETRRQAYEIKRQNLREVEAKRTAEAETIAQLQKEHERLKTQLEHTDQRTTQLREEHGTLSQQQTTLESTRSELTARVAQALTVLDRINLDSERSQQAISEKQEAIADTKQRILDLNNEMQRHRDRAALLRKFLESYEDHPEGVKHLLLEGGLPEGCLGTLGEKIHVPDQHRRAVETALGEAVVALLVDHAGRAFDGIALLQQVEKGAVTFLPLAVRNDEAPAGFHANGAAKFSDARLIGRLSDLVECEASVRPLVEGLIGHCYLVPSLAEARALSQLESTMRLSFVTPIGEIVTNWGMVRGGHSEGDEQSLIGRRQQIATLEDDIYRLDTEVDALITARERAELELRALLEQSEKLTQEKKSSEEQRQKLELEFGQASFEATKAAEGLTQRDTELVQLEQSHQQFNEQLAAVAAKLQGFEAERHEAESSYSELTAAIDELEKHWRAAEQAANDANVRVVESRAELRNAESERERLTKSLQDNEASIRQRQEEIVQAEQQEQDLTAHIAEVRSRLQEEFADRKELEDIVQGIAETFREHKTLADDKERQLRPTRLEREEVSEKLHQAELRISELTMERGNLTKHVWETYEVELPKFVQEHPVDTTEEIDLNAVEERTGWLRNRLKSMGPVNLLAISDYDKETERLQFLTSQREDLLKAEENLKETIKVINDTAYERFGKIFSLIRENFIQVFKSFFEGGFADLRIDEGDPLEADIVIEANPKGRKLASLALLSGGEKTLTAISLLFAIYLVKPSPFCILDEVDAPLDDSNVGRFTNAIRKFSENTQFICVTHNKGTMKSADYLYGITMEEQGISKVVSVKFDGVDQGNGSVN